MDPENGNIEHELDCASVFCAYGDAIDLWDANREFDQNVIHDRRMRFRGEQKIHRIELDRNTESLLDESKHWDKHKRYWIKSFNNKIDGYIRDFESNPDNSDVLIIVNYCPGGSYDREGTVDRTAAILDFLRQRKLGNHFMVTLLEYVLAKPYGDIWLSPLSDTAVSIKPASLDPSLDPL